MKTSSQLMSILGLLVLFSSACAKPVSLLDWANPRFAEVAPDSFDVEMATTNGAMVVRVRRAWSPHGVDRFHALVREHYFDDVAFHRVIGSLVAQFGIHGDSAVSRTWRARPIPDDSVRTPNRRGALAFARQGPNSRSSQLFFNLTDDSFDLDRMNGFGFPPIG